MATDTNIYNPEQIKFTRSKKLIKDLLAIKNITYIDKYTSRNIFIPDFVQKSKFIESLLLKIPITLDFVRNLQNDQSVAAGLVGPITCESAVAALAGRGVNKSGWGICWQVPLRSCCKIKKQTGMDFGLYLEGGRL